jgi:predicted nucleic acid-binding protein
MTDEASQNDVPARTVVLDTNVLVAAGFRPQSRSARIVEAVRRGQLRMVWSTHTRDEIRHMLLKIPPLSWERVADLFGDDNRCDESLQPESFAEISDPDDRHFAALAAACGATLITSDQHLLVHRGRMAGLSIVTPGEFLMPDDRSSPA